MTRKCATPPMTCPECGYIARLGELKAEPTGRRSFKCPGCGCKLVPDSAVLPLIYPAAPAGAFALCWAAGLRGAWLAVATLASAPAVWWLMAVMLLANFPPHLVVRVPVRRAVRPHRSFGRLPEDPPITLGLSAPPPSPHAHPDGQNDRDARGNGTDGA